MQFLEVIRHASFLEVIRNSNAIRHAIPRGFEKLPNILTRVLHVLEKKVF